mmetsp:Transcript_3368/g.7042  ORF Transcript_3368/g.7042 Transcript_3368/m.7042 type:complete len:347 (-) Transcript_3368:188-1228(-)
MLGSDLPRPKSVWQMLLDSNEGSCQELVKLLIEKTPRLKEEATKPDILKGTIRRLRSLPGLGLVGASSAPPSNGYEDDEIGKIGAEALSTAEKQISDNCAVGKYLSDQSRVLRTRIEQGAEIDDDFVNNLLGADTFGDIPLSQLKSAPTLDVSKWNTERSNMRAGMPPPTVSPITLPYSKGTASPTQVVQETIPREASMQGFCSAAGGISSFWKKPDELNLSGLLNVLDGVVDSPGRIAVMTSNHVNHFDPALIRPGRIDKKLFLGYMDAIDVVAMLQHYFQIQFNDSQKQRVKVAMNGGNTGCRSVSLTPAQIEQMTAEYDDIKDMLEALEMKGRSVGSKRLKLC